MMEPAVSAGRLVPALRQLIDGVSALHRTRQAAPRHQAIQRAGDARGTRRDSRLRLDRRSAAASCRRGSTCAGRNARVHVARGSIRRSLPSEASDWYGVGVTLYEALTGTRPFRRRGVRRPPPKRNIRSAGASASRRDQVPADLSALCMGLLHRESRTAPDRRRSAVGSGTRHDVVDRGATPATRSQDTPFVGRASSPSGAARRARDSGERKRNGRCRLRARRASARARWSGVFSASWPAQRGRRACRPLL